MTDSTSSADARRPAAYQLKLTLDGVRSPTWRRLIVPGSFTLAQLHDVFQIAMGWRDSHLHAFTASGTTYAPAAAAEAFDAFTDERDVRLRDLVPALPAEFRYEYDFGDEWTHRVMVERVVTAAEQLGDRARCLDGEGACPPEDVGGPNGLVEYAEAIIDPSQAAHHDWKQWERGGNQPVPFSRAAVDLMLGDYSRSPRRRRPPQG